MAGHDPVEVHRKGSIVALDVEKSKFHEVKSNGHGIHKSRRCPQSLGFYEVSRMLSLLGGLLVEEVGPPRRGRVQKESLHEFPSQ